MTGSDAPARAVSARNGAPRGRLSLRLGVGLCLGSALILVGMTLWNLRMQREHQVSLVSASADRIAETIRRSTRDAMMRNDPEELRRMIEAIGAQPGLERIRVFDKQGRIKTSTRAEEVADFVDTRAEQCIACHQQDRPLDRLDRSDRVRIFRNPSGARVLGIIAPIRNEPACVSAGCHVHPTSQRILGVLDVQLSLASVDEQLAASEWQLLAGIVATALAVLVLAWSLTWRLVLRPVRRLTLAATRVAGGDLRAPVPVVSNDELGVMGEAWNTMIDELARARQALEEWNRTLEERVRDKSRELERAHQQMLLVEKMASLGKLAAVVAHEINNPLAGVATYARLLRRRLEGGRLGEASTAAEKEEVGRALQLIEEETLRCGEIVRNLLLFSRTPATRCAAEALGPILERCALLLNHKAELQGVQLRVEVDDAAPKVDCDASQIQQMLIALAMNAVEATAEGGEVTLSVRRDDEGGGVLLRVADSGAGIPPEHLDRIFEPFFTTKEQGKGVGLGLAVVYGIVDRHHGAIEVDSKSDVGTEFRIRLPRRQPDRDATAGAEGPTVEAAVS